MELGEVGVSAGVLAPSPSSSSPSSDSAWEERLRFWGRGMRLLGAGGGGGGGASAGGTRLTGGGGGDSVGRPGERGTGRDSGFTGGFDSSKLMIFSLQVST